MNWFWAKGPFPGPFVSVGIPNGSTIGDPPGLLVVGYRQRRSFIFGTILESVSAVDHKLTWLVPCILLVFVFCEWTPGGRSLFKP